MIVHNEKQPTEMSDNMLANTPKRLTSTPMNRVINLNSFKFAPQPKNKK